jgi:thioredoxin 1
MKGNFNTLIQESRPVIVDFHAVWCAPCKMQSPILEQVVSELGDRIKVIKVDVDRNPEVAGRYNIRSVPTLMIFRNGEIIHQQSGVHSRPQLMEVLQRSL